MHLLKLLPILGILCINVKAYKILGVLLSPSKSHYIIGHSLFKGLAEDGHEVTVISPVKERKPIPNYQEVFIENAANAHQRKTAKGNFGDSSNIFFWNTLFKYCDNAMDETNWIVSSKNLQKFMEKKQTFDVVVVEVCLMDAFLGFGKHFDAPIVAISAFGATKLTTDLVGTPNFPSYIPHILNQYTDRMTFRQRMYNSLISWFEDLAMPFYYTPMQQKVMENFFPDAKNWPSLEEIRRNVSLVLLNTHTTLGTPRPYAPNMIEVGGMQIRKEIEPLPPKIQTFLDEANEGAIFVSLGTNVLISKMPEHHLNALVNAFSQHTTHRILIKCDDNVVIPSHNKSDVIVEPWFNQQSILAHKNIKLFVTHGGRLSTTEAIYFAKPIVGIPVFFDQHSNMYLAEQKGFGKSVPIETLTAERIADAVNKVLQTSSFAKEVKKISDQFRDQPLTPLETGMHWVKHVARFKGAPHLRSAAVHLPVHMLYNLDVWAFILITLTLFVLSLIRISQCIFSIVFVAISNKKLKGA